MGSKCRASHSHLALADDWKSPKRRLNAVMTSSRLSFLVSSRLQYACSAFPRRSEWK